MFRAGDHVLHAPTGETWVLACDEQHGEIVCCGWPETMGRASDCALVKAATDEERAELLARVAQHDDLRGSRARHNLAAMQPPSTRLKCCFNPCDADADFEVCGESGNPDDNTLACEAHVGAMLGTPESVKRDNRSWTVVAIAPGSQQ